MIAPALLVLASALALGADTESPDLLPTPTATILRRCGEGSPEYEASRESLGVVRDRIEALTR